MHQPRTPRKPKVTDLLQAAGDGDLAGVEAALAAGIKPAHLMGEDLRRAASAGHLAIVQRLLAAGSNADLAIPEVAATGQLEIIRALLDAGSRLPRWHKLKFYTEAVQCALLGSGDVGML